MKPTTKHFSEDELGSLAIALLEAQDKSEAENEHLRLCRMCSNKLDFFYQLYSNLTDELRQRIEAHITPSLDRGGNGGVIPLLRFPHVLPPQQDSMLILAAKERPRDSNRYTTLASFSSVNPPAVLRVLEDRQDHHWKIFILTDLPEMRDHVRVSLTDDGGSSIVLTTNEDGLAKVPIPEGFDWAHSHVAISPRLSNNISPTTR